MDDDHSHTLDFQEFKNGCNDYGLTLDDSKGEYRQAFDQVDLDKSGTVDFNEFLRALRPPMNQFRTALIRKAFQKLDKDKSGELTWEDLDGVYRVDCHPKFRSGEMTKEQVLSKFLETFEGDAGGCKGDGKVTWEEFFDYYTAVSASIDTDTYFNLMMVQAWKM
jgi:Ca2+-binding EF-hand superfamily protein